MSREPDCVLRGESLVPERPGDEARLEALRRGYDQAFNAKRIIELESELAQAYRQRDEARVQRDAMKRRLHDSYSKPSPFGFRMDDPL